VLLGRSGSGKTTTLKLVNRLAIPSTGEVRVHGKSNSNGDLIRLRRTIGYVIQEVGLFPHFTVARNIGLVPKIEGWSEERIRARTGGAKELAGSRARVARALPAQFSGRQPQGVGGGGGVGRGSRHSSDGRAVWCSRPIDSRRTAA